QGKERRGEKKNRGRKEGKGELLDVDFLPLDYMQGFSEAYGIFAAPYLGDRGRQICTYQVYYDIANVT
ncbi:hypothetical protein HKBW3S03_01751, partial [Candidatus Hakubella thermalkaliphila]